MNLYSVFKVDIIFCTPSLCHSTVICKNLVNAKVNKIELEIRLEGSDCAASIGAMRISVISFKTEIINSKNLASPSDSMTPFT